jgi:diguanylate cyclase (GGDEF)-like protein
VSDSLCYSRYVFASRNVFLVSIAKFDMQATDSVDITLFDKKPKFFGILLATYIVGVLLISIAVYRASRELEVIYEVDNMSRLMGSLLDEARIRQMAHGDYSPETGDSAVLANPAYRFYVISKNHLLPLGSRADRELGLLESVDLESTRVNQRGGYFEANGKTYTWVRLGDNESSKPLLVLHTFKSTGFGTLVHVYKQRLIIPVLFHLWLLVWVALILNHLLRKMRSQQDQMKQMALYDTLTGLPNRNAMEDQLLKMIQTGRRDKKQFAFSLIDLDGFKRINDNYGHAYGDELLRQAAKRLQDAVRGSDRAARLGGDEFIVLLSDLEDRNWQAAFARILTALIEPYSVLDTDVEISASVGVAIYPKHGDDADRLLRNADHAMYAAKADGGGIRVFEDEGCWTPQGA